MAGLSHCAAAHSRAAPPESRWPWLPCDCSTRSHGRRRVVSRSHSCGMPSAASFIRSRSALSCQRTSVGSQQNQVFRGQFNGCTCSVAVSCRASPCRRTSAAASRRLRPCATVIVDGRRNRRDHRKPIGVLEGHPQRALAPHARAQQGDPRRLRHPSVRRSIPPRSRPHAAPR